MKLFLNYTISKKREGMSYQSSKEIGLFVPTTADFEIQQLLEIQVTDPEFKQLLVKLYERINFMSIVLNLKDSAYYVEEEFVNGQLYPPDKSVSVNYSLPNRQVFRKIVDFGALPNTATKTVAHNISSVDANFTFTRIYGCASDPVNLLYIPIPYASTVAVANNVEISVDQTNVIITTGANLSAYTRCFVVLEYLRS